jgi:TP901 family phage tail tape measure protein
VADVRARFVYDADFSSSISQIKLLARELSVLNNSFNSLDKDARKTRNQLAELFKGDVGDLGAFTAKTVDITSNIDNFGTALDRNKLKLRDYGREARKAFQANSNARKLAEDQVRRTKADLVDLGMDANGRRKGILVTPLKLDMSDMQTQIEVARKQFSIFNKLVNDGATQLINWGKNTQWAGRQLTVGLTVPMTMFATATIKAFNDVDKELTRFQKVYGSDLVGSTKEATNAIRQQVQALAVDIAGAYGVAAKETAGLAADLAATGLEGQKLLDSIKQTTRLSVLGEIDRQDAMKTTLSLQNAFNMSTQELAESINFLNAVENQTSLSLQDLTEAIPKVGPVVRALGGDVKDLSVLMVAMKEGGINAAEGANALKSGLASLINPTKAGSEVAKQYGIDLEDIVKRNKGQLLPTVLEFQKSMQTLDDLGKAKIIEQLFGKYQFARISALFDNLNTQGSQTKQVIELMSASNSDLAKIANEEIKTLTESASMRFQRSMEAIKAALLPVGEAIVNSVLPFMERFAGVLDRVVAFAKELPAPVKSFLKVITGLTAVAGPIIMMAGVLGNFAGYIVKGAMAFVNLGRRIRGLPTEKFQLLDDTQIAASKATDTLTISIGRQRDAMVGLNRIMMDYQTLLMKQRSLTPGLFNDPMATAPPATQSRRPNGRPGPTRIAIRRQKGGSAWVPGSGSGDKIPALLEPGEFVINRNAAKQYGGVLEDMNNGVPRFQSGGKIPGYMSGFTGKRMGAYNARYFASARQPERQVAQRPGSPLKYGSEAEWERSLPSPMPPDGIAYGKYITHRRVFQARQADEQVSVITSALQNATKSEDFLAAIPELVRNIQIRTGIQIRESGETKPFPSASTYSIPGPLNKLYNDMLPGKSTNTGPFISILERIAQSSTLTPEQKRSLFTLVSNGDAPGDPQLIGFMSTIFKDTLEQGLPKKYSKDVAAKMALAATVPGNFAQPLRPMSSIAIGEKVGLGDVVGQSQTRSIHGIPTTENRALWINQAKKLGLESLPLLSQQAASVQAANLLASAMAAKPGKPTAKELAAARQLIDAQNVGEFHVSHAQSGGVIKAMRGIKMPEAYATKLATIRQSMAVTNKEAMSSNVPLVEIGTRQSRIGGHSSAIPGVNGVYEINGKRYVVKGHDTYDSAKAEADMARITRDVFGLQSPNQEAIRIRHPETGDLMFAVRSQYDDMFATSTGRFSEGSVFNQIIAAAVRRDKDLQAGNLWDNIVADVGQAGIMNKASQPRMKTGPANSVLEQLAVNLGMVKAGARSHGAEAWNVTTAKMTDDQIARGIKSAAQEARSKLNVADISQDFAYIRKDLDDIISSDLAPFIAHLRTVVPKVKKPPTQAALAKKEQQKILDREERQAALDAGYPQWAMQSGGILRAQDGAWVPGSGEGDRVPALLEPGEYVVNKKAAAQNSDLLNDINFNQAPRFQSGGVIPGLRFGGAFLPSRLPKKEYKKLVDSAYERKNTEITKVSDPIPTFGGGGDRRGQQSTTDKVPTYKIKDREVVFEGRGDDFSELGSKGIVTVKTTPEGLLQEAIRLNPKDQNLQMMLKNIQNREFNEPEIQLLDNIAASISVNRRGREQANENVDGFAMVLSALSGNESAKKLVDERTRNYHKIMQAKKAQAAAEADQSFLRRQQEEYTGNVDTTQIPAIHSTSYPVIRNADGSISIQSLGSHTVGTDKSVPRASVHLTLEAPVAGIMERSESLTNSRIVTRLSSMLEDNGMPTQMNPTDTWWMRNPGEALKLSDSSVIRAFGSRREYESELKSRGFPTGTDSTPVIVIDPRTKDVLQLRKESYSDTDRAQIARLSEEYDLPLMSSFTMKSGAGREQVNTRDPKTFIGYEDDLMDVLAMQIAKRQIGIESDPTQISGWNITDSVKAARIAALAKKNSVNDSIHQGSRQEMLETRLNTKNIPRDTKLGAGIEGTRMAVASGAFGSTKIEQRGPMFGAGVQTGGMIRAQNGAWVPGKGEGDRVPAMLEPGEFVVNKKAAKQYGGMLENINWNIAPRFNEGGDGKKTRIQFNPVSSTDTKSTSMQGRMPGQMPGMAAGAVSGGLMAASMASSMMLPVNKFTDALNKSIMALSAFTGILSAMQMLGVNMGGGFGKKMSGATKPKAGSTASKIFEKGTSKVASGKSSMAMSGVGNKLKGARALSAGKTLMGVGRTAALMTNPVGWAIAATMAVTAAVMAYKKALDSAKKAAQQVFGASKAEAEAFGVELRSVGDAIKANQEYTKQIGAQAQQSQNSTPGRLDPEKEKIVLDSNQELTGRLRNLGESGLGTTTTLFSNEATDRSGQRTALLTGKYASLLQEGFSEEDANIMVKTLAKASGAMESYYEAQKQFGSINAGDGAGIVKAQMEALSTFNIDVIGGEEGAFAAGIKEIVSNLNLLPPEDQYRGLKELLNQIETLDSSKLKVAQQTLIDMAKENYGEDANLTQALAAIQDKTSGTSSLLSPTSWDQGPNKNDGIAGFLSSGGLIPYLLQPFGDAENSQEQSTAVSAAMTTAYETGVITDQQLQEYTIRINDNPGDLEAIGQEIDVLMKERELKIKVDLEYKESLDNQLEANNKKIILEQQRMQDAMDAKEASMKKEQEAFKESQKAGQKYIKGKQDEIAAINKGTDKYIKSLEKRASAENFYQNQQKTALGGLSALASGDVFGFLESQRQMAQDSAQFGFDQEIEQIDEKRNVAVEGLQEEIDKKQEALELQAEAHEARMAQLETEREQMAKNFAKNIADMQSLSDGLAAIRGNDKILEWLNTIKDPFEKAAQQAAIINYLITNPAATLEEAFKKTQFNYNQSKPETRTTGTGKEHPSNYSSPNASSSPTSGGESKDYAYGGFVSGPGTPTSDSIAARLSNGEYVIKASSVEKFGKETFDQLNSGEPVEMYADGGFVMPTRSGKHKGNYKAKGSLWSLGYHTGLDFEGNAGTDILAVAKGTVSSKGSSGPYGNHLIIRHNKNLISLYGHLSRIIEGIKEGVSVSKGQHIGEMGESGNTTGVHLHLEMGQGTWKNSSNPLSYLLGADLPSGAEIDISPEEGAQPTRTLEEAISLLAGSGEATVSDLTNLMSKGAGAVYSSYGARKFGGSMTMNKPYLVGENGPEVVLPYGSGSRVDPSFTIPSASSGIIDGAGASSMSKNISIVVNGAKNPQEVAKYVVAQINKQDSRRDFGRSI